MKKSTSILIIIIFFSTLLMSCGPSFCDCAEGKAPLDKCAELTKKMSAKEVIDETAKCLEKNLEKNKK